jgi:acetyl esterase/lipase
MIMSPRRARLTARLSTSLLAWLAGCATATAPDGDAATPGATDGSALPDAAASPDAAATCPPHAPFDAGPPLPACTTGPTAAGGVEQPIDLGQGLSARQNLTYGNRGGVSLQGDLFIPGARAGHGPPGVLVVVHGGGWVDCANRRDGETGFAALVARALDVATFNIEYRLVQEGGAYPESLEDVKCAVQWIAEHGASFGVDGTRVAIAGASAGAHLALMVGLTQERPDLDPGCGAAPPRVLATISYSGPSDLPAFVKSTSLAKAAPGYYVGEACAQPIDGCTAGAGCDPCIDASPLAHACTARGAFVLVQAPDAYDPLVSLDQAEVLQRALVAAGVSSRLVVPTEAELQAQGCQPHNPLLAAHGNGPCLVVPSSAVVNPLIQATLGR